MTSDHRGHSPVQIAAGDGLAIQDFGVALVDELSAANSYSSYDHGATTA